MQVRQPSGAPAARATTRSAPRRRGRRRSAPLPRPRRPARSHPAECRAFPECVHPHSRRGRMAPEHDLAHDVHPQRVNADVVTQQRPAPVSPREQHGPPGITQVAERPMFERQAKQPHDSDPCGRAVREDHQIARRPRGPLLDGAHHPVADDVMHLEPLDVGVAVRVPLRDLVRPTGFARLGRDALPHAIRALAQTLIDGHRHVENSAKSQSSVVGAGQGRRNQNSVGRNQLGQSGSRACAPALARRRRGGCPRHPATGRARSTQSRRGERRRVASFHRG